MLDLRCDFSSFVYMRWFAFIFSFYIMALVVMPCNDAATCEQSQGNTEQTQQTHDHSDDEEDHCSPFCTCSCCGVTGIIISVPNFQIVFIEPITPTYITPYYQNFNSAYYYSFWQPPKLS